MPVEFSDDLLYNRNADGVYAPDVAVRHREDGYDSSGFDLLSDMQRRHFWYLGRHRFLLHCVKRAVNSHFNRGRNLRAVDLGGGCGGWLRYLHERAPGLFGELALADSSLRALDKAREAVGPDVRRYQIDLLQLGWRDRWDVVFLLDVLEHIPEDITVLERVRDALRPGGLLFVTTPALKRFWTYNDDLVHHVRRYSRGQFRRLGRRVGLGLCHARYFMFLLSPLLLLSRSHGPNPEAMTSDQIRDHLQRTHRVPAEPLNQLLRLIFSLETPLGAWVPFPWGTSVLGVFRKPA